jgi:hypothetical protein
VTDSASIPLLLIIWRRQDTLQRVINAIRPVAPRFIYVASDGPRQDRAGEAEQVTATRRLVERCIDWPCSIAKLYSDVNQGCRLGPITAISWFFSQEEHGIILEDDCVPHPDFFVYCSTLLSRYRDDQRVWCISGNNFQNGRIRGSASYYFSRYVNSWGWATWRSRWALFDPHLTSWPALKSSTLLQSHFADPVERRYWTLLWERTHQCSNTATWWDYQWQYALVTNHALSISPNVNLVQNIGFGVDATHMASPDAVHLSLAARAMGPLIHPEVVMPDLLADQFLFYTHYLGASSSPPKRFFRLIWRIVRQSWEVLSPYRA